MKKTKKEKSVKDFKGQAMSETKQKQVKGGADFIGHEDITDN